VKAGQEKERCTAHALSCLVVLIRASLLSPLNVFWVISHQQTHTIVMNHLSLAY